MSSQLPLPSQPQSTVTKFSEILGGGSEPHLQAVQISAAPASLSGRGQCYLVLSGLLGEQGGAVVSVTPLRAPAPAPVSPCVLGGEGAEWGFPAAWAGLPGQGTGFLRDGFLEKGNLR